MVVKVKDGGWFGKGCSFGCGLICVFVAAVVLIPLFLMGGCTALLVWLGIEAEQTPRERQERTAHVEEQERIHTPDHWRRVDEPGDDTTPPATKPNEQKHGGVASPGDDTTPPATKPNEQKHGGVASKEIPPKQPLYEIVLTEAGEKSVTFKVVLPSIDDMSGKEVIRIAREISKVIDAQDVDVVFYKSKPAFRKGSPRCVYKRRGVLEGLRWVH